MVHRRGQETAGQGREGISGGLRETITTHEYESKTLAKAFAEITGITVKHDLIQEGDVVEKLQTSMQSGKVDLRRLDQRLRPDRHALPLRQDHEPDRLHGRRGQGVHQPGPGPEGLHRHQFTTAPDGKLYQLPDQQFANLYWFRADLFARKDLKDKFKAKYGYDLGVPAELERLRGHRRVLHQRREDHRRQAHLRPHGLRQEGPSLGWRFTDAWLSMAGTADMGIPNGLPVDEWGIRVRRRQVHAAGRGVSRGGPPTRRRRSTR